MNKIQNNAAEIVITIVAVLTMLIAGCISPKADNSEIINTAEDIIEWIIEDEASGNVGREQADTYIDNLEEIIKELE